MSSQTQPDEQPFSNVYTGPLPAPEFGASNRFISMLQRQLAESTTPPLYWLVKVPEDGKPVFESFETVQELLAAIRPLLDSDVHLFSFVGHRVGFSDPEKEFQYLITPLDKYPLFDEPNPVEAVMTNESFSGDPLPEPATAPDPQPAVDPQFNRPLRAINMEPPSGDTPIFGESS